MIQPVLIRKSNINKNTKRIYKGKTKNVINKDEEVDWELLFCEEDYKN